jgi:Ca2+-binding RTX toxin-like protein
MSSINTHIALLNKEIEIVKNHIHELIGIDVSNLVTIGDLSNLEDNLKQYSDDAIPDLSETLPIDVSGITGHNPDDKLVVKEYVDTVVSSIDLSEYATKDELPNLSNCLTKSDMFYEGDPTKDIRIKYNSTPADSYNHENNIYIGGSFTNASTITYDSQNIVIGHGAKNDRFKNVLIGNNAQSTSGYSIMLGYNAKGYTHSVAIGADAQANGLCSIAIG